MIDEIVKKTAIEYIDPAELIPYEKNAKRHPPEQVKSIANSIRSFGWNGSAIQVDKDNVIINGHGRQLAAIKAGLKNVPVVRITHLSPEQIKAYRLSDNKVAESEYDTELLSIELMELTNETDIDLTELGFDQRDLDFSIEDLAELDLDAMTDNIGEEVANQSNATAESIDEEDGQEYSLAKTLGFSKINAGQQRVLSKFIAHCESETGETGAIAMTQYANDFVGI